MRYSQNSNVGKRRTKKGKGLAKGLYLEWLEKRLETASTEAEKTDISQQLTAYLAA